MKFINWKNQKLIFFPEVSPSNEALSYNENPVQLNFNNDNRIIGNQKKLFLDYYILPKNIKNVLKIYWF